MAKEIKYGAEAPFLLSYHRAAESATVIPREGHRR